ncbi:helix-turn-helix domain-containing protein [Brenneria corticis]|nr:helix-turn-helix transcriptional regulator [Brenneria sp. CFCC 11842]
MSHDGTKPAILKLEALSTMIDELKRELALNEEYGKAAVRDNQIQTSTEFGRRLNARRKELGIELATLELQTSVSISTLKRLFRDPAQVKFATVHAVSAALGVKLCAVE